MPYKLIHVDAFSSRPFQGNPAAVCLLDQTRPDRWMQDVASEMNLSETAFVLRQADGFSLRWFTPVNEVDLCGHATLATAHVLLEEGMARRDALIRFNTRSGLLTAQPTEDGGIELDFPATPAREVPMPEGLDTALGITPLYVGRSTHDLLVELPSEEAVRRCKPDRRVLLELEMRGLMITAPSKTPGIHFVSRFFAPAEGIDEDPVTGSAHCCLAPFWGARLGLTEMNALQCSKRSGRLQVALHGDRVKIRGHAVTVARAELVV